MVIEYTPHAAQMEIHRARGFRFRTVCTGHGGVPDHGAEQAGTGAGADDGGRAATGDVAGGQYSGDRSQKGRDDLAQRRGCAEANREARDGVLPTAKGTLPTGPWEVLTAEMRRYEYAAGPSGQVTYSAPSGYHDDCVMALALAVWGCRAAGVEPGRMIRMPELARGWGRRGNGAVLGLV